MVLAMAKKTPDFSEDKAVLAMAKRKTSDTDDFVYAAPMQIGILSGYRPQGISAKEAFWSIFSLHNESINIWTHAIGFLYFLGSIWFVLDEVQTHAGASSWAHGDWLAFVVYHSGAAIQMLTSAMFHTFGIMSESWDAFFLRIDIAGIIVQICGSYIIGMKFGFRCQPRFQALYISILSILLGVAAVLTVRKDVGDKRIFRIRNTVLAVAVGFGIVPGIHYMNTCSTPDCSTLSSPFFWGMAGMLGSYGAGFFFYLTKWPEAKYPGKFDLFLHSHQIWHAFIFVAGVIWPYAMMQVREEQLKHLVCDAE